MRIQTIHQNACGEVFNESSATGIRIDGPNGERLELRIADGKVLMSVSSFATITSGYGRGREIKVELQATWHECYECGRKTTWLAPDSRCGNCTRLTPDEVRGT